MCAAAKVFFPLCDDDTDARDSLPLSIEAIHSGNWAYVAAADVSETSLSLLLCTRGSLINA